MKNEQIENKPLIYGIKIYKQNNITDIFEINITLFVVIKSGKFSSSTNCVSVSRTHRSRKVRD